MSTVAAFGMVEMAVKEVIETGYAPAEGKVGEKECWGQLSPWCDYSGPINGKTVAAIVYHRRLHTVNLFVWPANAAGERSSLEDGFALTEWSEGGLRFAAVSDIAPKELGQFKQAYRVQAQATQH